MKVDLFDFELPEENIALHPVSPRENAKLLRINPPDGLSDYHVRDLPNLLNPGDALVFNDTKVIPAHLIGKRYRVINAQKSKPAGVAENNIIGNIQELERSDNVAVSHINVNLHMRVDVDKWKAFVKPARRLRIGEDIIFTQSNPHMNSQKSASAETEVNDIYLRARVLEKGETGEMLLQFDKAGAKLDTALALVGDMPLPPYIAARRAAEPQDQKDYQTVYAREEGAVAAPTAGLHFTPELLAELKQRGIEEHFVTLHVGAGTFLPVKVDDTQNHKMHSEIGMIDEKTARSLEKVKQRGGKIVAVGTTALRLLESAANENGQLQPWSGATDIFITPGYKFRFVDQLMTNFHLPRSTLFMLVSSFSGLDLMKKAYEHAVKAGYRFYSYGDTSLLDLAKNN